MTTRLLQIYLLIGLPVYILCTHNLYGQTLGVQDIASKNECRTSRCDRSCSCLVFKPKDCAQVLQNGCNTNGVYRIYPAKMSRGVTVYCDQETDGGGWVVFQRRKDGSVDFNRKWIDYKYGFGSVDGEHWLGNELLHIVASDKPQELRVDLRDFDNSTRHATYDIFVLENESKLYSVRLIGYHGNAGEALASNDGRPFSTKDNDFTINQIPMYYEGGWWYGYGSELSNPNGIYSQVEQNSLGFRGIKWIPWKGKDKTLKATEFKIRPH